MKVERRVFLRSLGLFTGGVVAGAGLKFVLEGLDPRPPINKEGRITILDLSGSVKTQQGYQTPMPQSLPVQESRPTVLGAKPEKEIEVKKAFLSRGVVSGVRDPQQTVIIWGRDEGWSLYRGKKEVIIEHRVTSDYGKPDNPFDDVSTHKEIKINRDAYVSNIFKTAYMTTKYDEKPGIKLLSREQKKEYKKEVRAQIELIDQFFKSSYKYGAGEKKYLQEVRQQLKSYLY